jgi:Family of unknown function (DUF6065)
MQPETSAQPIATFHRVCPSATPPLRGDKAALGTLPAAAFQYCEPVRTASSYGWYIFPPVDIRLFWNGVDVMYSVGGEWQQLTSIALSDEFAGYWDDNAPAELQGCWPPFMTAVFVPGIIQIWSGLLVSTAKDWSMLLGPPSNIAQSKHFQCFEGMIETDNFRPCPLFINIRLSTTDQEILIPRTKPLFQVRPVHRDCYTGMAAQFIEHVGLGHRLEEVGGMTPEDWTGYSKTVRRIDTPREDFKPGTYGATRRRDAKRKAQ